MKFAAQFPDAEMVFYTCTYYMKDGSMFRPKPSHGKTNEWFKMNMEEYLAVLFHT